MRTIRILYVAPGGVLLLLLVALIGGCGTAKTIVLEAPEAPNRYQSISIVAHNPTVQVPAEVTSVFEGALREKLYDSGPFTNGTDMKLFYTFVSHDAGDRFARWFWGGIGNAGEGSVTVMVRYLDKEEAELARTQVEGRIGSGFFGGSMNEAITKAAQDVAEYTINNFGTTK